MLPRKEETTRRKLADAAAIIVDIAAEAEGGALIRWRMGLRLRLTERGQGWTERRTD